MPRILLLIIFAVAIILWFRKRRSDQVTYDRYVNQYEFIVRKLTGIGFHVESSVALARRTTTHFVRDDARITLVISARGFSFFCTPSCGLESQMDALIDQASERI